MTASLSIPFSQLEYQALGNLRTALIDVTLATNDYLTNGIDISSYIQSGDFVGAIILGVTGAGAGRITLRPVVDITNKKLLMIEGANGDDAEEGNGASDAIVVRLLLLYS